MSFTENSTLLAIESSCDETSAAVLLGDRLASNIVSSQLIHARYGGVVPELASRAHINVITDVVRSALEQAGTGIEKVAALAVTSKPGLVGSLIVGTSFAKGLSLRYGIPLQAVNHIDGHIYSAFLEKEVPRFPILALVVSGGHTSIFSVSSFRQYELVGSTRDDAAGEAFDKTAKLLGLGYPGGVKIDRLAQAGNPKAIHFPRAMLDRDDFDFSFSGLKTAVRTWVQRNYPAGVPQDVLPDVCASVQEAICEVLALKALRAARACKSAALVVAGGVSANSRLRVMMAEMATREGLQLVIPAMEFCTDNAAMIGMIGRQQLLGGQESGLGFTVSAKPLRAARKKRQKA